MKIKGKTHYWVDVVIAAGFLVSAVSGIVLLALPSGGFQGGRNASFEREVLFMGHAVWNDIHVWGSLVMTAGVLLHLILHWDWIKCMTRNVTRRRRTAPINKVCETQ